MSRGWKWGILEISAFSVTWDSPGGSNSWECRMHPRSGYGGWRQPKPKQREQGHRWEKKPHGQKWGTDWVGKRKRPGKRWYRRRNTGNQSLWEWGRENVKRKNIGVFRFLKQTILDHASTQRVTLQQESEVTWKLRSLQSSNHEASFLDNRSLSALNMKAPWRRILSLVFTNEPTASGAAHDTEKAFQSFAEFVEWAAWPSAQDSCYVYLSN